jgi:hypothetical protein
MRHSIAPRPPALPLGPFRWLLGMLFPCLPRRLIFCSNLLIFILLTV